MNEIEYNIFKEFRNFNNSIGKVIEENDTLNVCLDKFLIKIFELLYSLNIFEELYIHCIEVEINDLSEKGFSYCQLVTLYDKNNIVLNSENVKFLSNKLLLKRKLDEEVFLNSSEFGVNAFSYKYPIYFNYDNNIDILHYVIEFEGFKGITEELIIIICELTKQLIEINGNRILNHFQKKIIDKIEYVSIQLRNSDKDVFLETELNQISEIIKTEVGYDICTFLICYPDNPHELKYLNLDLQVKEKYNIVSVTSSLAVKSFTENRNIKLLSTSSILENTNINLVKEIESNYNRNKKVEKEMFRWTSIVIKGRDDNAIGLIKLFHFHEKNKHLSFFNSLKFLLLKSIQRNILHIIKDFFIFQNEIETRNNVIDNLMHQIVSPLNALLGHCRNLLDRFNYSDRKVYEKITYIKHLASEGASKARGFQSLINFEHGDLVPKIKKVRDIRLEVLKKIIDYQPKARKDKGISIHLFGRENSRPLPAYIDIELFSHVVSNLLDNAIKYSFDPIDRYELRYRKKPSSEKDVENILIRIYDDDSNVYIKISNLGASILEEERNKVFKRKYRGINSNDYSVVGNGIGLYIVEKFLHLMNGEIELVSEKDPNIISFLITLNY